MIKNPSGLLGLSRREITYRAMSTVQIELSRLAGDKSKKQKKRSIDETPPPPDPPSKLPTKKSPISRPRRHGSPDLYDAYMEEMDQLTNPFNYYEQNEDEDYSYTRRVIPKPDIGHWQEVPSEQYRPALSDVSEPDDFSSSHKVVERPASPTQLTATFTTSHTVQFTPHPHPIPSILQWRLSPVEQPPQQPQQDQMEGPMWDPTCLISPACE